MRVLLLYKSNREGANDPFTSLMPTGLGYINALLRENGFQSRLANLSSASWHAVEKFLLLERPDIVGISQFTHNRADSLKLACIVKKLNPASTVVLGGPHATYCFQYILEHYPAVDAVVLGEGEETFLELVRQITSSGGIGDLPPGLAVLRDGKVIHSRRKQLADLDSLPFPALHYRDAWGCDLRRQMEFIITSRGCPASCRFCSSPGYWGKSLRFRSPQSMVNEIRHIRDTFGLLYFSLRDDTFTARKDRVIDFCRLLLQEKVYILWNCQSRVNYVDEEMLIWMKRAGCECVQYGVESGSEKILEKLGKRITPEQVRAAASSTRRAGISLSVYLITGVPGESEEDTEATIRLINDIRPSDGQVSPLVYYPGTELFAKVVKSGKISGNLFDVGQGEAFQVRKDPFVARSMEAMLRALGRAGRKHGFTARDFAAQKQLLGYCHTTNVMAGEWFEAKGDYGRAEEEYAEITRRQPENPLGWLALGEFYSSIGEIERAEDLFTRVISMVPAHIPAHLSLGELKIFAGDRPGARRHFMRAYALNPCDRDVKECLERHHIKA